MCYFMWKLELVSDILLAIVASREIPLMYDLTMVYCNYGVEKENFPENSIVYLNQRYQLYKDNKKIYYADYFLIGQVNECFESTWKFRELWVWGKGGESV